MNTSIIRRVLLCGTIWHLTAMIVFAGFAFGRDFLRGHTHPNRLPAVEWEPFANWDGYWYTQIVEHGYFSDPTRHSNVAFFPGFVCLPILLRILIPVSAIAVLVAVSNASLLAALWPASRFGELPPQDESSSSTATTLVALCLWPMGLFLRVAYSEALFLLMVVVILHLIRIRGSILLMALIAGAATGTRSVGVALLLPLAFDWWQRSHTFKQFAARAIVLGPMSCWGLMGYMIFLQWKFGDPLLFMTAQQHWAARGDLSGIRYVACLLTLEPLWTVYIPESPAYWASHEYVQNPLFSLQFWNPIYFVTCAALVSYGAWKKWLSPSEWLLSAGLLGIPYVLQGYRMMMLGHGRFTCVVFPMFIVLGRVMSRWPWPLQAMVFATMAVQLFYWSALFAAWHRVF